MLIKNQAMFNEPTFNNGEKIETMLRMVHSCLIVVNSWVQAYEHWWCRLVHRVPQNWRYLNPIPADDPVGKCGTFTRWSQVSKLCPKRRNASMFAPEITAYGKISRMHHGLEISRVSCQQLFHGLYAGKLCAGPGLPRNPCFAGKCIDVKA